DVTYLDNGQIELRIANQLMIRGADQIDSLSYSENTDPLTAYEIPGLVQTVNGGAVLNDGAGDDLSSGKLKGILDMGRYDPAQREEVNVYGVLNDLNDLLTSITDELNALQSNGRNLNGALTAA